MADADVGKLFVGGISRETTENTLKEHFSKYGDVSASIIAKDRLTNTPRGFGFVTFFDSSSVDLALEDRHVISGRMVEVKKATPRNGQQTSAQREQLLQQNQQQFNQSYSPQGGSTDLGRSSNGTYGSNNTDQNLRTKKIFVGGLSTNLTEEGFRSYFEQFGRITDVVVMHDNTTNRPRGFGFITFDSEQVVENIMQKSHHELAGKRVEVKRAVPREATKYSNNGNGSSYNRYDDVSYNTRGPRYESYSAQAPMASATYPGFYYNGAYYGGYNFGGYGFYGYGMPPVFTPPGPWNGFGTMGGRPFAYGTGYYPSNVNGGVAMMGTVNPYNNFMEPLGNGKLSQNSSGNNNAPTKDTINPVNAGKSDLDESRLKSAEGVVNGEKSSENRDLQDQGKVSS